jgi:hypothetical protein
MKKIFDLSYPEEARFKDRPIKKHHELKSFGRFWYQENRAFLNSKRTVVALLVLNSGFRLRLFETKARRKTRQKLI